MKSSSCYYKQAAKNKAAKFSELHEQALKLQESLSANELEMTNAMSEFGQNITDDMKLRQGYNDQIKDQVWEQGLGIEHAYLVKSIDHQRELLRLGIKSIENSGTPAQDYCDIANKANKFMREWRLDVAQMTKKWLDCFDDFVAGEQSAIQAEVKQDLPSDENPELVLAFQKIQQLEQALVQSDQEIQLLLHNITDMDNVIDGLREENAVVRNDNVVKTNKIAEQANKIMDLQDKLSDKIDEANFINIKFIEEEHKVDDFKHKIDTYKINFNNFIEHHENIEGYDHLVDMLGDLNI